MALSFQEIPQFTKSADYQVDQPWDYFFGKGMGLDRYIQDYGLDMDPDFQRAHVWDEVKQIRFVEYVLQGGRSGLDIYFNHPGWMSFKIKGPFVLVDGKQRLEAARRFMENEIPVFGGHFRKDITGWMGTTYRFRVHINDLLRRAQVLQWYLDLNRGGVLHTDEEIAKVEKLLEEEKAKSKKD